VSGGDVYWQDLRPALQGLARRLDYIDEHLVHLGRAVGYSYAPMNADAPAEVKELMRADKTLEAIKVYRQATGASLDEAREYVYSL
jgi:ribosomal protein L7/L12